VTAESLAKFCGIADSGEHTDDGNIVNLKRQLGILQQQPRPAQFKIHHELAAKYLPALVTAYKASTGPSNAPMTMLNVVSYTPYFVRFQRTPEGSNLATIQVHRTASTPPESASTMDIDTVGEIVQFLATLLLLQGTSNLGLSGEEEKSLLTTLKGWKAQYRGSGRVAEMASERCIALLTCKLGLPAGYDGVKDQVEKGVDQCGAPGCNLRHQTSSPGAALSQCARCKTSVYCGKEHQKQAWASHKSLCFKPVF